MRVCACILIESLLVEINSVLNIVKQGGSTHWGSFNFVDHNEKPVTTRDFLPKWIVIFWFQSLLSYLPRQDIKACCCS